MERLLDLLGFDGSFQIPVIWWAKILIIWVKNHSQNAGFWTFLWFQFFLVFLAQKKNVAFAIKLNGIQECPREIIAIWEKRQEALWMSEDQKKIKGGNGSMWNRLGKPYWKFKRRFSEDYMKDFVFPKPQPPEYFRISKLKLSSLGTVELQ